MTIDLHYQLAFGDEDEGAFSISVLNATDEDPPPARLDLGYDSYTHNAFGQMVKVGLKYGF